MGLIFLLIMKNNDYNRIGVNMNYKSTRDSSVCVSAATAIANGISKEGGLYVPEIIPSITHSEIREFAEKDYRSRAEFILSKFLKDFTDKEILDSVNGAYTAEKFGCEEIAPLSKLDNHTYILELWHGPTCAFKDMALQILPYLLMISAKKTLDNKKIAILVATSGDTGKAALEGFKDVDGTSIIVFYPEDGVSHMQKLQMITQEGSNVSVCAIKGNFDDAQSGVKKIFTDNSLKDRLNEKNIVFSSANSINWGRLVPQIIYYFSAYCDLIRENEISCGDEINIVVPTGNFGNILAAYYAKKMGVPIKKLICASNSNNVLTDFIKTGEYNKNRNFFTTISPSMDILISSNLERLLYDLTNNDSTLVSEWMDSLSKNGYYKVNDEVRKKIDSEFYSGYCDDSSTKSTINDIFKEYNYLCDTHTAVAVSVYNDYVKTTKDKTKTVIASTANPYKFAADVLSAVVGNDEHLGDFEAVEKLNSVTDEPIPKQLIGLDKKEKRFSKCCQKSEMENIVLDFLGIK